MKRVRAFGPACIGNLAAGFDVLGAAVAPAGGEPWGDVVEIGELPPAAAEAAPDVTLVCDGPFAHQLPADPADNVAVKACAAVARIVRASRAGRVGPGADATRGTRDVRDVRDARGMAWPLPRLELRLTKGLPVGSGLGSSSATVVAVVRALDALLGRPLDEAGLLEAAGEAEAYASGAFHLDNVAAALLGGVRLVDPGGRARLLTFPDDLRFVLAVPALTLTTRAARAALPATVPLGLAVAHAQNLAALVHALDTTDRELLRACLRDLLAEPHRAALVPGFRDVQAAGLAAGAWGCSLSGAGPAVFAVAEAGAAPAVGEALRRAWAGAGIACEIKVCVLDRLGARVLEPEGACG